MTVEVAPARTIERQARFQRLDVDKLLKRTPGVFPVFDMINSEIYAQRLVKNLQFTVQFFHPLWKHTP